MRFDFRNTIRYSKVLIVKMQNMESNLSMVIELCHVNGVKTLEKIRLREETLACKYLPA